MSTENTQLIRVSIATANTSGITDYHMFVNVHSDFTGAAVPSGVPIISIPLGAEAYGTYTATETGFHYFRVYSYNREANFYSTSYVSGSALIDRINNVKDVIVGNLKVYTTTGLFPTTGNSVFNTFELNPTFLWDLGSQNGAVIPTNFNTRITIRKHSETLTPSLPLLAEHILFTSGHVSGGKFTFDFEQNKRLNNGPYREYDLVVEAVDRYGFTSAGNTTMPQAMTEGGWATNPDGFDIIRINNQPISGLQLTSGSSGALSFQGINYNTEQYFDAHGNANIVFSGIKFPDDIVGGRVFVSRDYFTGLDAATGLASIKSADFQIDNQSSFIYAPTRLNTLNLKSGWMALMLFDTFDQEYKKSNATGFWTGLYVSNTVGAYISGNFSELGVSNFVEFFNNSGNNNGKAKVHMVSTGGNSFSLVGYDSIGQEIVYHSYKE